MAGHVACPIGRLKVRQGKGDLVSGPADFRSGIWYTVEGLMTQEIGLGMQ